RDSAWWSARWWCAGCASARARSGVAKGRWRGSKNGQSRCVLSVMACSLSRERERAGVRVARDNPLVNDLQHRLGLREHFAVRKPQDGEPMPFQHCRPRRILSRSNIVVVLAAVELDDE